MAKNELFGILGKYEMMGTNPANDTGLQDFVFLW